MEAQTKHSVARLTVSVIGSAGPRHRVYDRGKHARFARALPAGGRIMRQRTRRCRSAPDQRARSPAGHSARHDFPPQLCVRTIPSSHQPIFPPYDDNFADRFSPFKCIDGMEENRFPVERSEQLVESHSQAAARRHDDRCQHDKKSGFFHVNWRCTSWLKLFPSARPASFVCSTFITAPICAREVAPASAIASRTAAASSSGRQPAADRRQESPAPPSPSSASSPDRLLETLDRILPLLNLFANDLRCFRIVQFPVDADFFDRGIFERGFGHSKDAEFHRPSRASHR